MKNKRIIFAILVLFTFVMSINGSSLAACACHEHQAKTQNLDLIKQSLIEYHDSGSYQKDQASVIKTAKEYLEAKIASPHQKPLAIVLDIDETSLSNYPDMLKMNFGGTFEAIDDAEGKGTDPVIKPTLELYRFAKAHNVAVFFVTGRREKYRDATAKNLEKAGYKAWDDLMLKPQHYHTNSAAPYKIETREKIEKKGFEIVLNIGDQQSDLVGGFADKTFKMPNPYYIVP